ncbi:hypothetical protein LUZ60_006723 [Juncus effusus]|nr:hypothetical protein LUZ60_006723 [Juncus effusus]
MKYFTTTLFLLLHGLFLGQLVCSTIHSHVFLMKEAPYTRLCKTKKILTVNGEFPGPTLYVYKGDIMIVKVINIASQNITIHWHGVKQPRNPWSDGPAYITQCPIMPGGSFTYFVKFTMEEGTLWWHAHNDFYRATVHGAIVIYPRFGASYPFPKPYKEHVVIFGEWWKEDTDVVFKRALQTGGNFNNSDAYTINGQPGDLYQTFKIKVAHGRTYLLRMINSAMSTALFVSVANHKLTLVGSDASYTSPLKRDYIVIFPGETLDLLLEADQSPKKRYYMAARAFDFLNVTQIDNTTTTAIIEYISGSDAEKTHPVLPQLPYYNDTNAATSFTFSIRSLVDKDHEINVLTTFSYMYI